MMYYKPVYQRTREMSLTEMHIETSTTHKVHLCLQL